MVNGQLMAVGGFDGTTYLKTIEVYDPDANTWRYKYTMRFHKPLATEAFYPYDGLPLAPARLGLYDDS